VTPQCHNQGSKWDSMHRIAPVYHTGLRRYGIPALLWSAWNHTTTSFWPTAIPVCSARNLVSLFSVKSLKLLCPDAFPRRKKCLRPGLRARPRWGSLQHSPDPLAGFKGPTSKGRGGKWEGRGGVGKGRGRRGKGEGKGKGDSSTSSHNTHTNIWYNDNSLHLFNPPILVPSWWCWLGDKPAAATSSVSHSFTT